MGQGSVVPVLAVTSTDLDGDVVCLLLVHDGDGAAQVEQLLHLPCLEHVAVRAGRWPPDNNYFAYSQL